MPANPHVINLATRPRQPSLQERQAEREERLARVRLTNAQKVLQISLSSLLHPVRRYDDRVRNWNFYADQDIAIREKYPEFEVDVNYGVIVAAITPIMWLAIFLIDMAFLGGVSHLMISLINAKPGGPSWWEVGLTVAAILTVEMAVAILIASTSRKNEQGAWRWKVLGGFLAVVVPLLAMTTTWTTLKVILEGLGIAQTVSLMLGFTALAVVCHGSVILGGENALRAFARLSYGLRRWWFKRQARKHERAAQTERNRTQDAFRAYEAELRRYREVHGVPPNDLQIHENEIEFVNNAMGEAVVVRPAGGQVPPDRNDGADGAAPMGVVERVPPGPNDGADGAAQTPDRTESGTSSTREEAGVRQAENEAEGQQAETEYLRSILSARQRDADGEVGR